MGGVLPDRALGGKNGSLPLVEVTKVCAGNKQHKADCNSSYLDTIKYITISMVDIPNEKGKSSNLINTLSLEGEGKFSTCECRSGLLSPSKSEWVRLMRRNTPNLSIFPIKMVIILQINNIPYSTFFKHEANQNMFEFKL